jgi:hypothetical protein
MVGDSSCKAVCNCDSGRKGSFCAYTEEQHTDYTFARYILTIAIQNLTDLIDVDDLTMSSVAGYLEGMSRIPDELTTSTRDEVFELLSYVVSSCAEEGVEYFLIEDVLDAVSFLLDEEFLNSTGVNTRRRLANAEEYAYTVINEFAALVVKDVTEGETAIEYALGEFTMRIEQVLNVDGRVNMSAYVDPWSASADQQADQISIEVNQTYSSFGVGIASMRLASYGFVKTELLSHPLLVTIENQAFCPNTGCNITLLLENVYSETYSDQLNSSPMRTGFCEFGTVETLAWACPSGVNATAFCNGTFEGIVTTTCGYFQERPACSNLDGNEVGQDVCNRLSYDSIETQCICTTEPLVVFAFPDIDGYEEVSHISFANTIENVYKDEESTFTLYTPTSLPSGQPSSAPSKAPDKDFPIIMAISVPIVIGCCIISCCILLFLVYRRKKDEREKDKMDEMNEDRFMAGGEEGDLYDVFQKNSAEDYRGSTGEIEIFKDSPGKYDAIVLA